MQLGWRAHQLLPWMRRYGSNWFTPTSNSDAKFQIIDYRYHTTKLPTKPDRPTKRRERATLRAPKLQLQSPKSTGVRLIAFEPLYQSAV